MSDIGPVKKESVNALIEKLDRDARDSGYHLNPDAEQVRMLAEGLLRNKARYGYASCPCRLADGERESDLDIICPCYYRDADLTEYGACYCALYVSSAVARGEADALPVPERRPPTAERERHDREMREAPDSVDRGALAYAVWRCSVCGYLCAREQPPDACPVCKASRDRFGRFM